MLDTLTRARSEFSKAEWKDFLLRSMGLEPSALTERQKGVLFLRMVPFLEPKHKLAELEPRGTGKSDPFQQMSPYAHLICGAKESLAQMFVNIATGQRGLVCAYDVVCFDVISGISF